MIVSLKLNEIANVAGGRVLNPETPHLPISGASIDTRTIKKGEMFFALAGKHTDGHLYLQEAIRKGSPVVIVRRDCKKTRFLSGKANFIACENPLTALQNLAAYYRRKFNPHVIAITGSNGKTTTKELITHILKDRFNLLYSRENYNNAIGISLAMFGLSETVQCCVFELGINRPKEMAVLAGICLPRWGLITNIGKSHLQYFRCPEQVLSAKMELIACLPSAGKAFFNGDDNMLKTASLNVKLSKVFFGFYRENHYCVKQCVQHQGNGGKLFIEALIRARNSKFRIKLPGWGKVMMHNTIAAVAVCREKGVSLSHIGTRLSSFALPQLRMNTHRRKGVMWVNDSYNANPTSVYSVVQDLTETFPGKRIFVVLGDMKELGTSSAREHRLTAIGFARKHIHAVFTMGKYARLTHLTARAQGILSRHFANYKSLFRALVRNIKAGDIVLIKGSRLMQMENIWHLARRQK